MKHDKKTDSLIEFCTWDIWEYVRHNKMSLVSETACKAIAKIVAESTCKIHVHLRGVIREQTDRETQLRLDLREAKKMITSLKREIRISERQGKSGRKVKSSDH